MMNPLVSALAKAVPKRPALEQMDISYPLLLYRFHIPYYPPGVQAAFGYEAIENVPGGYDNDVDDDYEHLRQRRIYHNVGSGLNKRAWEPSAALMHGIRCVGYAEHGGKVYQRIMTRSDRDQLTAEDL